MADVFHDAGYVENWAQGIRRVMEACEINGNPAPEFALEREGLAVFVSSTACQESVSVVFVPTENQKRIIDCILTDPSMTQNRMAEITGLSEKSVRNNLSKLVDAGVVRREGSKKDGRWIIISG